MIEHCHRCRCQAPPWDSAEYRQWQELISQPGEYLGVVCPGCLADEDLLLLHCEASYAKVD